MTLLKDADLLKSNKQALVDALNHYGISGVTMETPLDKFPKYIKSLGGIPYYEITVVDTDGQVHFIDCEEWDDPAQLSVAKKGAYAVVGLSVSAEGRRVIISKTYGNNAKMKYAANYPVEGVENYPMEGADNGSVWNAFSGAFDCDKILAQLDGTTGQNGISGCPAVKTAMQYSVAGVSADAMKWYLPSVGELLFIKKYLHDISAKDKSTVPGIQTMLGRYGMDKLFMDGHYTCTPSSDGLVYFSYINYSYVTPTNMTADMYVRSVGMPMEEYNNRNVNQ